MGIESITFWLNSFIPNSACELKGNLFAIAVLDRFFTGDQREFSSDVNESSRMHSWVRIDGLSSGSPQFVENQACGESHEVDGDGNIIATATAPHDRMHFTNLRGSQTVDPNGGVVDNGIPGSVQIDLFASASLPLMAGSPDNDYSGTLIIDIEEGNLLFKGAVQHFPAYEMYFIANDGPIGTLAQLSPDGIGGLDLIGAENRSVDVSCQIML